MDGLCPIEFNRYVSKPALKLVSMWCPSSERLMLGTPMKESELKFLKQNKGKGRAVGLHQMEPTTFAWLQDYLTNKRRELKHRIITACYFETMPTIDAMFWNLRFSTLMARVRYAANDVPLPDKDDVEGLARYYVKYYNRGGASTLENSLPFFQQACDICNQEDLREAKEKELKNG